MCLRPRLPKTNIFCLPRPLQGRAWCPKPPVMLHVNYFFILCFFADCFLQATRNYTDISGRADSKYETKHGATLHEQRKHLGWRERIEQDATNLMFIIKLLSQHVSRIIMPIIRKLFHSAHSSRPSSTQPQPSLPVQNTICGSAHSCSRDDGHNDARNMLR